MSVPPSNSTLPFQLSPVACALFFLLSILMQSHQAFNRICSLKATCICTYAWPIAAAPRLIPLASHQSRVTSHHAPSPLLTTHCSLLTANRERQIFLRSIMFTFLYTQNIFVLA